MKRVKHIRRRDGYVQRYHTGRNFGAVFDNYGDHNRAVKYMESVQQSGDKEKIERVGKVFEDLGLAKFDKRLNEFVVRPVFTRQVATELATPKGGDKTKSRVTYAVDRTVKELVPRSSFPVNFGMASWINHAEKRKFMEKAEKVAKSGDKQAIQETGDILNLLDLGFYDAKRKEFVVKQKAIAPLVNKYYSRPPQNLLADNEVVDTSQPRAIQKEQLSDAVKSAVKKANKEDETDFIKDMYGESD